MISAPVGHVEICADAAEVAQGIVDRIILAAQKAIGARGRFIIALAGGSSPRTAYQLLAQTPHREMIDWEKCIVVFGDERCVPPIDNESNYKMASEALLAHVPIPPDAVLRMRGEENPGTAAAEYSSLLRKTLGAPPVIDFVLLGLGPDAHTASWFPDVLLNDTILVDAPYVPKFSSHRITLTPSVINAAREIVVATSGAEKAEALAAALGKDRNVLHIPSQRLAPHGGTLTWLVDEAAGGLLGR